MNTATITRRSRTSFSFEITYLRDTDYSFVETTVRSDGREFSRKLEKGIPEYGNTCHLFHMNNVELLRGNTVVVKEHTSA